MYFTFCASSRYLNKYLLVASVWFALIFWLSPNCQWAFSATFFSQNFCFFPCNSKSLHKKLPYIMPAFMIPSSSTSIGSLSSNCVSSLVSESDKTQVTSTNSKHDAISNRSSSTVGLASSQSTNTTGFNMRDRSLQIDTKDKILTQIFENQRYLRSKTSGGNASVALSDIKALRVLSPVSMKDSMADIQRKLKHNLSRYTQNG